MKSLLIVCACLSLIVGAIFYAVSGSAILAIAPAAVGFTFIGVAYAICSIMLKEEAEEEDYSAYQSAHSL